MKEYIFGVFPCVGALRANRRTVYKLMVKSPASEALNPNKPGKINKIISIANEKQITVDYKSKDYLDRLVGNRPHQNIVMKASSLSYERPNNMEFQRDDDQHPLSSKIWLALDQIQDPMNFGAILRSAGYFGVDGIIASKRNSCRLSPVVSKASAGTMEWLKIYGVEDLPQFLKNLSKCGWDVIGSTMPDGDASQRLPISDCTDISLNKASILVLGNEGIGIREEVLKSCNKFITIPSFSQSSAQDLDSLNVSVASGVLLYSLVSKRKQLQPERHKAH